MEAAITRRATHDYHDNEGWTRTASHPFDTVKAA